MKYKEMADDVLEAVAFIPRSYALTWLRPGQETNKVAFSPSYEFKDYILRSYWPRLARQVEAWAEYKKQHPEYLVLGRHMNPLFPAADRLLKVTPEDFREAVKRKESTYVTDVTPGEAVRNLVRKGKQLSGDVKAKSHGGYYEGIQVRNAYVGQDGKPNIITVFCPCREHAEYMGKGDNYVIFAWDVHPTALVNEALGRRLNPTHLRKPVKSKGQGSEAEYFHPFNFATNWVGERGRLTPISEDLAMLQLDMAIDYYFNGSTYFDINQKVFQLPDVYSDSLIRAAADDECRFELLSHGAERRQDKESRLVEAEKHLLRQTYGLLAESGYEYEGRCLEFGRPALRFESSDNVLNFVPGQAGGQYKLPFYVTRPKPRGGMTREQMCQADNGKFKPARNMNIPAKTLDDWNKQETSSIVRAATTLIIPERENRPLQLDMPSDYEDLYRSRLEKSGPDPQRNLRAARLLFKRH